MSLWELLILFGGAIVASATLVSRIRDLSPRLGLLDTPNQRSLHIRPTPRGGGIAFVIVCAAGIAVADLLGIKPLTSALGYLVGGAIVVVVSIFDDIRSLPVVVRLLAQLVASVAMLIPLIAQFSTIPPALPTSFAVVLAVIWVIGVTNAYNFMDGSDGLIGVQGFVGGLVFAGLAWLSGLFWFAAFAVLVAGSCLGFLLLNWSPAQIFMGDVGSVFLGFTFAFFVLAMPRGVLPMLGSVLILWPILFDVGFTLFRRVIHRHNPLTAHRSHIYQRLILAGHSPASVALGYGSMVVLNSGIAVVTWSAPSASAALALFAVGLLESIFLCRVVGSAEDAHRSVSN